MKTILVRELRPVRMTTKTLVFEDSHGETYMATRRVANDILMNAVTEVFVVETSLPRRCDKPVHIQMLATPSCW